MDVPALRRVLAERLYGEVVFDDGSRAAYASKSLHIAEVARLAVGARGPTPCR